MIFPDMKIKIKDEQFDAILQHAQETYREGENSVEAAAWFIWFTLDNIKNNRETLTLTSESDLEKDMAPK